MVYTPPKKRTFGQTVKKWSLRLAFAAAIGGIGYNYYGTQEDIEVKINTVDVIPSSKKDKAPEVRIHTDKGTFVNHTTWMYAKGESDVEAINQILKPGATVKLSVYGINTIIGRLSFEDFGNYRNITTAETVSNDQTPALVKAVVNTPVTPVVKTTAVISDTVSAVPVADTTAVVTDSIAPAPINANKTAADTTQKKAAQKNKSPSAG